jgi:light-regulated signal transduction histidine kinase (bacteriophytochrome)
VDRDALLASGVHVYLAVPMIAGGELIGALSFGGESSDFPAESVGIAQEVAAQLAIAMMQARLLERVRSHADELERRVALRTAELAAANRELEAFSYSVSHDLRAPLRAVDGYARMLEEDYGERLDDEGRRLLGVVRASSRQMGRLIDDLLAFSRLGRQAPAKRPVDMTDLAREAARELTRERGGNSIDISPLPATSGDPSLLKQVWLNLVGNAIKYSAGRDPARVEIGGREDGGEALYWVRDNGVGFDMRYAEKLFRVFQRLHRAEEFSGTGVGLAIVERIVTRHDGRVWAESRLGEGACFYFALPK